MIFYGVSLIIAAVLFKLAAAPLHQWAPDLYNAVPTPLTYWMFIIPKFFLCIFLAQLMSLAPFTKSIIMVCSIFSMIIGAIGLYLQKQIKRIATYSGILNIGYLTAFLVNSSNLAAYYNFLIGYTLTMILFFSLILYHEKGTTLDIDQDSEFQGFSSFPLLVFILCIFSLAGVPPFLGFFMKFNLLVVLYAEYSYTIIIIVILTSIFALKPYFKLIQNIFSAMKKALHISPTGDSDRIFHFYLTCVILFLFCGGFLDIYSF